MSEQINKQIRNLDERMGHVKTSVTPLAERLETTPGLIYERKRALYELSRRLSGVKKALGLREAKINKDVSQQKDEEDKPRYATVAIRENEVMLRLSKDEEYQALKRQEDELHEKFEMDKIDLDFLQNVNSNAKRMVDLEAD